MSRPLAAAALIALAAVCISCTSRPPAQSADQVAAHDADGQAPGVQRLDAAVRRVVNSATPSVVRIFFGEGDALTGTIISPDGIVLTCAHLPVPVGGAVTVGHADGRRSPAKVLSKLPEEGEFRVGKDIALVQILAPGPWPCAPVAAAAPVSSEEPLLALGFPDTMLFGSDRATDPLYVRMGFRIRDP